jgi:hypothetical protein
MTTLANFAVGTDAIPAKGTTSPVTWYVYSRNFNQIIWKETSSTIYTLYKTASVGWRLPTAKSKLTRVNYKLVIPVDRPTVDSASNTTHNVVGNIQVAIETIMPAIATSAEKQEAVRIALQQFLDSQVYLTLSGSSFPS